MNNNSNTSFSSDYTITNLSSSVSAGDYEISITTSSGAEGKNITIVSAGDFGEVGYGMENEVLRISDGTTTIDYIGVNTEGGAPATGSAEFGLGSGRQITDLTSELTSKINSSALNITATDNGGDSSSASMTLTPGTGITITISEDPTGDNQFGDSDLSTSITDSSVSTTTKKIKAAPFRFLTPGAFNIRGQGNNNYYKTFIGERKS